MDGQHPVEAGSILWKRVRRGETTPEQAQAVLQALAGVVTLRPSLALMPLALLVTADEKFYNALRSGPLAVHIVWVEDTGMM